MKKEPPKTSRTRKVLNFFIILAFVAVLFGVLVPIGGSGHFRALPSAALETSRVIGTCMYRYSVDHNGHYPDGKTSTEVFQQLIDEHYVDDPSIFYFGGNLFPQKVRPSSNHLAAENVCWDTTCCVDSSAPDGLPVVFLTGYKISYQAGSKADPFVLLPERSWFRRWLYPRIPISFMAAAYTSSTPTWGKDISERKIDADDDGSIPNFIPADFDAKGKTYRQLTP